MELSNWLPLVGVALGGVITWLVAWTTRRNANQREDARWEKERDRDQEAREREQQLLTYEHRRQAYVGFILASQTIKDRFEYPGRTPGPASSDLLDQVWEQTKLVQIYGTRRAQSRCTEACKSLVEYIFSASRSRAQQDSLVRSLNEFRDVVREDLAVPE